MQHDNLDVFETRLDETAKAHLLETTRWTKFLGICMILVMTLTLVYVIFGTLYMNYALAGERAGGYTVEILIVVVSLIIIGVYIYPIYALLKFSSAMKRGIQSGNQGLVNDGFRYQKNMFRYTGILFIISLMLILLSFVAGGIGTITGA